MGDLGKLIVAKDFKKSNKSPNLVTLLSSPFFSTAQNIEVSSARVSERVGREREGWELQNLGLCKFVTRW